MNLKSTIAQWSATLLFSLCLFTVSPANAQVYCSPSFVNGCFNWSSQTIVLDSINWSLGVTDCTTSDYTNLSTTLTSGVASPMTVTSGVWCGCAVWMDFNLDGAFDTTEYLYHAYVGGDPGFTYSFSITVPANTPSGTYRMRVIAPWGSDGYTVSANGYGGCGSYQYGNFDDFTVHVVNGAVGIANPPDQDASFIEAGPNPVTGPVTVKVNHFNGSDAWLQLTDVTGKIIQTYPVKNDKEVLDMSALPKGIYIIRYSDGVHHQSIRLNK